MEKKYGTAETTLVQFDSFEEAKAHAELLQSQGKICDVVELGPECDAEGKLI